jgi:hypothetical protein
VLVGRLFDAGVEFHDGRSLGGGSYVVIAHNQMLGIKKGCEWRRFERGLAAFS